MSLSIYEHMLKARRPYDPMTPGSVRRCGRCRGHSLIGICKSGVPPNGALPTLVDLNHLEISLLVKDVVVAETTVKKLPQLLPILCQKRCFCFYWGLTPQQQPGSYQGGEMIMMKSVFWWRKTEYPEETTDLQQVTKETFHTYGLCPVRGLNLGRSGVKQSELRRDEVLSLSGGFTPCRHLRPSSGREHTIV